MIDCKTEAESTYLAIRKTIAHYNNLRCRTLPCPVVILISGNRAISTILKEGFQGIGIDGRPTDLGKDISTELMPVISDNFSNWSSWKGNSNPRTDDLKRIRALAQCVHAEGKKLRLWNIPDNEIGWSTLIEAGVDFISTDHLEKLHTFLQSKGL
jgi:hypothetical protein